mmetsp:Transcript_125964/g.245636  ORF Transcript_125964/g.245636 Transcript_125964/m.245636 type:complete len:403 (-) Transcript_125964:151-1359(-)
MVRYTASVRCTKDKVTNQKTVNQYKLLSQVGQGTYSKVRWAEDGEQRCYAVKVYCKNSLAKQFVSRFDKDGASVVPLQERVDEELRILGDLNHRHVCSLEEVMDDPEHHKIYAVLEGLPGGQLMAWMVDSNAYSAQADPRLVKEHWRDAVHHGPCAANEDSSEMVTFQEKLAAYLFRQLLEAVAYLHERGIIHKDLKPDNIMLSLPLPIADSRFMRLLSLDGWPDVAAPRSVSPNVQQIPSSNASTANSNAGITEKDEELIALLHRFPLAAKIGDFNTSAACPQPDCLIFDAEGTNLFTPPECFDDHPSGIHGKPRDVWSLGCILFVMLFGRCPFWEESSIMLQLAIMSAEFIVPGGVITTGADSLLHTMLAREPGQRPSAADVQRHAWFQTLGGCCEGDGE